MRYALFLFYNKARGKQAVLSAKDKKHVDVIIAEDEDITIFQYSGRGIQHKKSNAKDIMRVRHGVKSIKQLSHYILVRVNKKHSRKNWLPLQLNSCNETCRKISGAEIGWTFNPSHLYNKLIRKNGKTNYDVIEAWSR